MHACKPSCIFMPDGGGGGGACMARYIYLYSSVCVVLAEVQSNMTPNYISEVKHIHTRVSYRILK